MSAADGGNFKPQEFEHIDWSGYRIAHDLDGENARLLKKCAQAEDEIARLRDENGKLLGLLGACRDNLGGHWGDTELSVESVGCPDAVPARVKEAFDSLRDENAKLRAELNAVASALPGPIYMDPPDGGSVTVAEQVARMTKDAARYRWLKSMAFEQDDTYIVFPEISAWDYQPGPQLNEKFPILDAAIDAAMQKGE